MEGMFSSLSSGYYSQDTSLYFTPIITPRKHPQRVLQMKDKSKAKLFLPLTPLAKDSPCHGIKSIQPVQKVTVFLPDSVYPARPCFQKQEQKKKKKTPLRTTPSCYQVYHVCCHFCVFCSHYNPWGMYSGFTSIGHN